MGSGPGEGPALTRGEGRGGDPLPMRTHGRTEEAGERLPFTFRQELLLVGAIVGAITLCLTLAARRAGWPLGQTFGNDVQLVQIYAAHYRHGDLFPVWSSSDAYGMGSPVLLFYQKAFFMVGGVVFILLGGALKATLMVTLGLFMAVGAYGMRRALGMVTASRLLIVVGSIGFLFTNEAFTEWLARGDLAEFTALMVSPWVLHWCLNLVKYRRVSFSIVPAMVVLVDAHNAVALVWIFALAVTGVVFVVSSGWSGIRTVAPRLSWAVAATTLLLAPMLVAELKMGHNYDPIHKVTLFGGNVSQNYANPIYYLYEGSYHWLANLEPYPITVQMDFAITALIVVGAVAAAVRLWRRRPVSGVEPDRPGLDPRTIAVLVVSLAIYYVLQLRAFHFVFDLLTTLKVISFPYRMMAVITPLALVLAVGIADGFLRTLALHPDGRTTRFLPVTVASIWLISLIGLSPVTAHEPGLQASMLPTAPFFPIPALTVRPVEGDAASAESPLFLEYLPNVDSASGRRLPTDGAIYASLHATGTEGESLGPSPCTVVEAPHTPLEATDIDYRVTCAGPARVALPISFNSFTAVDRYGRSGRWTPVAIVHVPTDPRIVVSVGAGGTERLVAHLPTLSHILF